MNSGHDQPPPLPPTDGQDSEQEILGGFPRHLTQQLIKEEGQERAWKTTLAVWLIGAGLATLALAFPQERLIGRGPSLIAAWSQGEIGDGFCFLYYGLLRLSSEVSGLRFEQAAFLLSALLYGACFPALFSFGRRLGVPTASAIAVTAAIMASPAAWLAGTTPGPSALGLLTLIFLFKALWQLQTGATQRRQRISMLLWFIALTSLPSVIWCQLAVMIAMYSGQPKRGRLYEVTFIALALGGSTFIWWLVSDTGESLAVLTDGPSSLPSWSVALVGLGLAWAGLSALLLQRRNESEERAPLWLAVWAGLPLLVLALDGFGPEISAYHLLPLAALGGFDALGRRADDLMGWEPAALVLAAAALLVGFMLPLNADDHLAKWRTHTRQVLEPDDLVLTSNREHAYLLRERWGLEVLVLQDVSADERRVQMADARQERQRIVLGECDAPLPEDLLALPRLSELSPTE